MAVDIISELSDQDTLRATGALVIYMSRTGAAAMAHRIIPSQDGGPPTLGSGDPLAREAILRLSQALMGGLGEREGIKWIPDRLLVAEADVMAWWTPAQRRPIFFETKTEIDMLNARHVLHPPLLFIARPAQSGIPYLRVLAMPVNQRPTPGTQLLRAPYFNLYDSGLMCPGTAPLPDWPNPSNTADWETAFFDSSFVHTNLRGSSHLTTHEAGHQGLWMELAGAHDEFPMRYLLPARPMKPSSQDEILTVEMAVEGK